MDQRCAPDWDPVLRHTSPGSCGPPRTPAVGQSTRLSLVAIVVVVVVGVVAFGGDAPLSRAGTASSASMAPSGSPTVA
ncbi:MAG TPA: hypothetical protein VIK13_16270, partial [Candidatus Limnocylindrales bacterium]